MRDAILSARESAAAQPLLFSESALPAEVVDRLLERESQGDYTAERLRTEEPRLYVAIAKMLAAHIGSVRAISFFCGVTEKTVVAVREANTQSITAFREHLTRRRQLAMARGLDVVERGLDEGTAKSVAMARDAAVCVGILDQHDRLDSGAPTSIVQVEHLPAAEDYRRFLEARTIGSVAEDDRQKGGDPGTSSPT